MQDDDRVRPLPSPPLPDAGPFRSGFWKSPLRGPWLASFLSSALLPLIVICALTGFLSHAAYEPGLGDTGLTKDAYLGKWLLLCAVLFAGSALLFAFRARALKRPR